MRGRCAVVVAVAVAWCPTTALAQTTSFGYTGTEQTYTVPAGYHALHMRAAGAPGGALRDPPPPPDNVFNKGRGALVEGDIRVTPGQLLYLVVGGSGGLPDGGFNGGGRGAARYGLAAWGGGGATDVRTISISQGAASLESRLVVAAGGGGTFWGPTGGGEAGFPGPACCATPYVAAEPGTQREGGAGGSCGGAAEGCGTPGGFGFGGDGGASGEFADSSFAVGAGGGGGWFGGGGGPGHVTNIGGGAGGSSKRPGGGTVGLADLSIPPQVQLTPIDAPPTGCTDGADGDADGLVDYPADPGCADADDEDEWNPDTSPPEAGVSAPRTQKLGRSITVQVRCLATAEDCIISATGTLTMGRAARTYKLKRVRSVVVPRGKQEVLRLGVPTSIRAMAGKALRARNRIHAEITVRVTDETGNVRQMARRVRLVRGSP